MSNKKRKRRWVIVEVNPSVLSTLIRPGRILIESQVPKDAKYLGVHYNPYSGSLLVYLEHRSFRHIPEGEKVPILNRVKITELKK